MSTAKFPGQASDVRFQCAYGVVQKKYWWLFGLVGVIGLIGVPIGIFMNTGWEMGNRPVEPWAATLIIEIFSVGALLTAGYMLLAHLQRTKSPQRVALTQSALIIPKGAFSREELRLPLAEIDISVFNAGFVKQLQIKQGRRKILLTSALFPSDADFDSLVSKLD